MSRRWPERGYGGRSLVRLAEPDQMTQVGEEGDKGVCKWSVRCWLALCCLLGSCQRWPPLLELWGETLGRDLDGRTSSWLVESSCSVYQVPSSRQALSHGTPWSISSYPHLQMENEAQRGWESGLNGGQVPPSESQLRGGSSVACYCVIPTPRVFKPCLKYYLDNMHVC